MRILVRSLLLLSTAVHPLLAQRATPVRAVSDSTPGGLTTASVGGLRARSIGPAMTSGRVMTLAVHPKDPGVIYVGTASGGVWKSVSGGASWDPIFDREGSYSIGWLTLDPKNPNVIWVGTGERNSQRSVAYGDGVYKSDDGGRSWKNVGLKSSEHIGRIVVHPENSDIVYVAAQGPLWSAGGDRGLYKTTDGGATWNQVLKISDHTGVTDVVLDPRNPDVIVASAYQRRRHFFTLIDGGPESAIHRSTDGGKTWTKVNTGLPTVELGRIGLAISPMNPDVLYANVEAATGQSGLFRSADNGVTWARMSNYSQGSMYYGDVFADPHTMDRIYVPDVQFQVSDDGGRTTRDLGQRYMHVDNHIIWVDPANPNHYLVGNDGGLYRSWDRGATWTFFENLPLAQYYDVDVDNALPFYNVYGGLQDNYSLGMPSRTKSEHGILNEDVFVTQGGDGFVSRVDPEDPNTVYAELQEGNLIRFDKRTQERINIQPQEEKDGVALRFNWDAPLIISPHNSKRLYFAAQFVFRSDDRGDTWRKISPDLTRQVNRNSLAVMGKIWGPDAVAKNTSTADYSNISAVAESPRKEGLLYVGTDDGIIQVTEDGGTTWRKAAAPPGAPADAYVTRIRASQHDANVAYATFSNHQNGDFAPYAYRTTDAGRSWSSITGNLPTRGGVFAIAEDHVDPQLLFVGTEYSAYFSKNGGTTWTKVPGVPTIKVAELAIQKRENDLVIGTFGRGIYIVDDYRALRTLNEQTLAAEAALLPVRDALLYVPTAHYGGSGNSFQGEMLFTGDNPPYGALFTYHIKTPLRSLRQQRQAAERAAERAGRAITYPSDEQLRAEAAEEAPATILTVRDAQGKPIRTINGSTGSGVSRTAWDLRYPPHQLPGGGGGGFGGGGGGGPYVVPGSYSVTLSKRVNGVTTQIAGPVSFNVVLDDAGGLTIADHQARGAFQAEVQELRRKLAGATSLLGDASTALDQMRRALDLTPAAPPALHARVREQISQLNTIRSSLAGDRAVGSRGSSSSPASISQRINGLGGGLGRSLARPTNTMREQLTISNELFAAELVRLKRLVETDLPALEGEVERAGAPYTAGRRIGG